MPLEAVREVSSQLLSPSFTTAFQQLLENFLKFFRIGSDRLFLQLQRKLNIANITVEFICKFEELN